MNLADIRQALYDRLSFLEDTEVYRTPVDNPTAPGLMIDTVVSGGTEAVFGGARAPVFPLILMLPSQDPESAYDLFDQYLSSEGSLSIEALLYDEPTLGGVVGSVRIVEFGPVDPKRAIGIDYLAVEIMVEVWCG